MTGQTLAVIALCVWALCSIGAFMELSGNIILRAIVSACIGALLSGGLFFVGFIVTLLFHAAFGIPLP